METFRPFPGGKHGWKKCSGIRRNYLAIEVMCLFMVIFNNNAFRVISSGWIKVVSDVFNGFMSYSFFVIVMIKRKVLIVK